MILCPRCLTKIDKELHDMGEQIIGHYVKVFRCPKCKQEMTNLDAISTVRFPELITKVRYVGLNSWEDANKLLKMMQ